MEGDYSKWRDNIEVLMSAEQISERIQELGKAITESYPAGTELCVVGVLKGSFLFFADLVRQIELPLHCEFIGISSYGDETTYKDKAGNQHTGFHTSVFEPSSSSTASGAGSAGGAEGDV